MDGVEAEGARLPGRRTFMTRFDVEVSSEPSRGWSTAEWRQIATLDHGHEFILGRKDFHGSNCGLISREHVVLTLVANMPHARSVGANTTRVQGCDGPTILACEAVPLHGQLIIAGTHACRVVSREPATPAAPNSSSSASVRACKRPMTTASSSAIKRLSPAMSTDEPPLALGGPSERRQTALIITWNPDGVAPKSGANMAKLATTFQLLAAHDIPDALGLQETLLADATSLARAQQSLPGYTWFRPAGSVFASSGFDRGVALLIRGGGALDGGQMLTLPWDDEHRIVAYDVEHVGLLVVAYMPAVSAKPGRFEKRLEYERHLTSLLAQHRSRLIAVVGDLNVAPASVDCTNEWGRFFLSSVDGSGDWRDRAIALREAHASLLAGERLTCTHARSICMHPHVGMCACTRAHACLLAGAGLVDAWRHHHPTNVTFSSFQDEGWQRSGNGWRARVDHVLVPRATVKDVRAHIYEAITARVPGRYSDHVPVGVRVEVRAMPSAGVSSQARAAPLHSAGGSSDARAAPLHSAGGSSDAQAAQTTPIDLSSDDEADELAQQPAAEVAVGAPPLPLVSSSRAATSAAASGLTWTCAQCTFLHAGVLLELTTCTMCSGPRPAREAGGEAAAAPAAAGTVARQGREEHVHPIDVDADAAADDGHAPRIVIDLESPDESHHLGSEGGRERGSEPDGIVAIDLTVDDHVLARQLQRSLDVEIARAAPLSGSGAGGPIDFKALNGTRQRRLAAARRRDPSTELTNDDLLCEQRQGLEARCNASAAQLRLRVSRLWHNPRSQPGQPLYERFVAAWQRVPDKTLRLVFHATKDANMDAICRDGLNPAKRGAAFGQVGGKGEYFGREVATSAPYSQGSRKMLIFAILMDRSGLTSMDRAHPGEIVINRREHQARSFLMGPATMPPSHTAHRSPPLRQACPHTSPSPPSPPSSRHSCPWGWSPLTSSRPRSRALRSSLALLGRRLPPGPKAKTLLGLSLISFQEKAGRSEGRSIRRCPTKTARWARPRYSRCADDVVWANAT